MKAGPVLMTSDWVLVRAGWVILRANWVFMRADWVLMRLGFDEGRLGYSEGTLCFALVRQTLNRGLGLYTPVGGLIFFSTADNSSRSRSSVNLLYPFTY